MSVMDWSECVKLYGDLQNRKPGIMNRIQNVGVAKFTDFIHSFKSMTENKVKEETQAVREVLKVSREMREVSLRQCDLSKEHVKLLLDLFVDVKLTKLDVSGNSNLTPEGWLTVGQFVKQTGLKQVAAWRSSLCTGKRIEKLIEGMDGAKLTKLDTSGNENISPKGWLNLGRLVKQSALEKLIAGDCKAECVEKLRNGMDGAKLDYLKLSNESGDLSTPLLELLPLVNEELDLEDWRINEDEKLNLQERLNERRLTSLTIKVNYVAGREGAHEFTNECLRATPVDLLATLPQVKNVKMKQDGDGILVTWDPLPNYTNIYYYVLVECRRKTVGEPEVIADTKHRVCSIQQKSKYRVFIWGSTNDSISKFTACGWCRTEDIPPSTSGNPDRSVKDASIETHSRKRSNQVMNPRGQISCHPKKAKLLHTWRVNRGNELSESLGNNRHLSGDNEQLVRAETPVFSFESTSLNRNNGLSESLDNNRHLSGNHGRRVRAETSAFSAAVDPTTGTQSTFTDRLEDGPSSSQMFPSTKATDLTSKNTFDAMSTGEAAQSVSREVVCYSTVSSPILISTFSYPSSSLLRAQTSPEVPEIPEIPDLLLYPRTEASYSGSSGQNLVNSYHVGSVAHTRNEAWNLEHHMHNGVGPYSHSSCQYGEASSGMIDSPSTSAINLQPRVPSATLQHSGERFMYPLVGTTYTPLSNVSASANYMESEYPGSSHPTDLSIARTSSATVPDVSSTSLDYPTLLSSDPSVMETRLANLEVNMNREIFDIRHEITTLNEKVESQQREIANKTNEITSLKENVENLRQVVESLKNGAEGSLQPCEASDPDRIKDFTLPMDTAEDVEKNEKLLQDRKNAKRLIAFLITFGGSNKRDVIWRIMKQLFTNGLAIKYSWEGKKGKRAFCKLKVADVVKESSKRSAKKVDEAKAQKLVMAWLKNAGDRGGGRKKRERLKRERDWEKADIKTKLSP